MSPKIFEFSFDRRVFIYNLYMKASKDIQRLYVMYARNGDIFLSLTLIYGKYIE